VYLIFSSITPEQFGLKASTQTHFPKTLTTINNRQLPAMFDIVDKVGEVAIMMD
jgi:hypothetical protein